MKTRIKSKSLSKLARSNVETDDMAGLLSEIKQASDRTAVIVLSSWVERSLEQSILSVLFRNDDATKNKLLGPGGPLNGFYSKIQLGLALGIYDEMTRGNLELIRNIRNAFAHSAVPITFQTKQVLNEVAKLEVRSADISDKLKEELSAVSPQRRKFTAVCVTFAVMSQLRAAGMKMDIMSGVANAMRKAAEKAEISGETAETLKTVSDALGTQYSAAAHGLTKLDID